MTKKATAIVGPIRAFSSAAQWEKWLAANHAVADGIWLRMFKKHTTTRSVNYAEALDVALCYGWIDSQKRAYDEESWIQRFTPRRSKSVWSKTNIQHTERLIASGRMQPLGLAQVEAAKADGRWTLAYDSARTITLPEDFLAALQRRKKAAQFFQTLNRANVYAIAYRLQTAKTPATRERRMAVILDKLERGEKWHA